MPAITIRNVPPETHRALRMRAAANGRSTEAEIRAILDEAVRPAARRKLGSTLVELFRPLGGVDLDLNSEEAPAEPIRFE